MSNASPSESEIRNNAFAELTDKIPYIAFLGVDFQRRGDEVTALLNYTPDLIGNPILPALHGGATGAFLEITAITSLNGTVVLRRSPRQSTSALTICALVSRKRRMHARSFCAADGASQMSELKLGKMNARNHSLLHMGIFCSRKVHDTCNRYACPCHRCACGLVERNSPHSRSD